MLDVGLGCLNPVEEDEAENWEESLATGLTLSGPCEELPLAHVGIMSSNMYSFKLVLALMIKAD